MADAKASTSRRVAGAKAPRARKTGPAVKAVARNNGARPASAGGARETEIQGAVDMATKTNGATAFAAADQFGNAFAELNERTRTAFEKSAKLVEEFADLTRGNVEALVASTKVAAKGAETLSQDAAEFGRKAFEEASSALRSFSEAKTPTDFFKLQSEYARSAFDAAIAESARVSEAVLKIAGDAVAPITSRYAVAAERVKSFAA
jgi:phasin family protein